MAALSGSRQVQGLARHVQKAAARSGDRIATPDDVADRSFAYKATFCSAALRRLVDAGSVFHGLSRARTWVWSCFCPWVWAG
jgi:hypothetical protein